MGGKKCLFGVSLCLFLIPPLLASETRLGGFPHPDALGWHWYNEPVDEEEEKAEAPPITPVLVSPVHATSLKKILQGATQAALDKAVMFPSPENFRRYKLLQDFWAEKASQFTQSSKEALLMYPELDYNLKFSHYNGTTATKKALHEKKQKTAIAQLSQENGVFYFYRGNEPVDVLMGVVVASFAREYAITLIPVSVDGKLSPELVNSRRDTGQAQRMAITHYPALFLVNPATQDYTPIAYGFHSQEALAEQFLLVATGFKREF